MSRVDECDEDERRQCCCCCCLLEEPHPLAYCFVESNVRLNMRWS